MDTNGSNAEPKPLANVPIASLQSGSSRRAQLENRLSDISSRLKLASVYVVFCPATGLHKIGVTSDMQSRLAQLQATSAYSLELRWSYLCALGTEQHFEKILHTLFADCRTHGEWFKLAPEDLWFLMGKCPLVFRLERDSGFYDPTPIAFTGDVKMLKYPRFHANITKASA